MAERSASWFQLRYAVRVHLRATPAAVWARLTDAAGFPRWNSTVESIEGDIAPGSRLQIRVPAAPGRTFTPTVVAWEAERHMTWSDGFYPMFRGVRTFALTPGDGGTTFDMVETFQGLFVPLVARSLPDFGPIFDRYAADLRAACEGG
ncbi:MAG TPA: SRPBCC domain-containing protein [Myxococcota bacterium]|nr:SRPBCC domain-containing protein [Myxococcota bacterium]